MNKNFNIVKIAGQLYLGVIVFGGFAQYIRSTFIINGNAITSANNILANPLIFRVGIVSDLLMIVCYFLLPLFLYIILSKESKRIAGLMVLIVMMAIPIMSINMLNQFAPLILLSSQNYLQVFNIQQLQSLSMVFLELHKYGYFIAQIFFGLWLLPLGILVIKSKYFTKSLGILLIIACFAYIIDFLAAFLFPSYSGIVSNITIIPIGIAEILFCGWLLFKKVKEEE